MNYKESIISGEMTTWRRLSHGSIYNEPVPRIELHDEDRSVLPDGRVINNSLPEALTYRMEDPSVTIPMIDPATFEPTAQTITAGEVWLAMASVYIWMAKQRDEPAPAEEPVE